MIIILAILTMMSASACGTEPQAPEPVTPVDPVTPPVRPPPVNNTPEDPQPQPPPVDIDPDPIELGFPPLFILHEYYYPGGSDLDKSLFFRNNGSVEVRTPESTDQFTFEVIGLNIIILDGESPVDGFDVVDAVTLKSMLSGEVFALQGAFSDGLIMRQHYFLDGDKDSESILFHSIGGDVDLRHISGEITKGAFAVSGDTVTIEYHGTSQDFLMINSYLLETEDGARFIRVRG